MEILRDEEYEARLAATLLPTIISETVPLKDGFGELYLRFGKIFTSKVTRMSWSYRGSCQNSSTARSTSPIQLKIYTCAAEAVSWALLMILKVLISWKITFRYAGPNSQIVNDEFAPSMGFDEYLVSAQNFAVIKVSSYAMHLQSAGLAAIMTSLGSIAIDRGWLVDLTLTSCWHSPPFNIFARFSPKTINFGQKSVMLIGQYDWSIDQHIDF